MESRSSLDQYNKLEAVYTFGKIPELVAVYFIENTSIRIVIQLRYNEFGHLFLFL